MYVPIGFGVTSGWLVPKVGRAKARRRRDCSRSLWCDIRVVVPKVERARARRRRVYPKRFWCDIRVVGSKGRESKSQKEKGMSQDVLV